MLEIGVVFTALLLSSAAAIGFRSENTSHPSQFECSNGISLIVEKVCDGRNDCGNWDDECDCHEPVPTLCAKHPCLNGQQEVRRRQLCDGVFDCEDLSDECMCDRATEENFESLSLCQKLLSESEDGACRLGSFDCVSEPSVCLSGRKICDGVLDCVGGIDESFCGTDENWLKRRTCRKQVVGNFVGTTIAACECDGRVELPDGSDEKNCSRYLYCVNDFDRGEHLADRNTFGEVPGVFIDWRRGFDGVADCPDARDEWHDFFVRCPEETEALDKCRDYHRRSLASSSYALKSRVFAWLQWFVGLVTIAANGAVMTLTIHSLWKGQMSPDRVVKRANQILVLSLSLSDFLLGVQMLGIAASDAYMSGSYWKYDTSWKSSAFCLTIGFVAITLTQVSILTVVVISALRLYTLMRPFAAIRLRYVTIAALAVWGVGLFVAKMPTMEISPEIEDYFVQAVAVPNLPQVDASVVDRTALEKFVKTAAILTDTYKNQTVAIPRVREIKWKELEALLKNINPKFASWRYFGYFSHTSMCLPTVIVSMGDKAWEYTFGTVVVDVFAYGFVVVAYVVVMKKTVLNSRQCCIAKKTQSPRMLSRNSQLPHELSSGADIPQDSDESVTKGLKTSRKISRARRSAGPRTSYLAHQTAREKENRRMQNRIFLLVFTDFLCWAPILALNIASIVGPHHDASGVSKALSLCFILLQLNSMTNPFIYSTVVRQGACAIVLGPCRAVRKRLCVKDRNFTTDEPVTHFATASAARSRSSASVV